MVYKGSQAFMEKALATYVIGDKDQKFGRSNQQTPGQREMSLIPIKQGSGQCSA